MSERCSHLLEQLVRKEQKERREKQEGIQVVGINQDLVSADAIEPALDMGTEPDNPSPSYSYEDIRESESAEFINEVDSLLTSGN